MALTDAHHRPFLSLWVIAVAATVAAFVVHLALRGRTMALGYELGKVRAEQARLREVKRVLELEVASYHTPQRVEMVARTVLRMEPPAPERILLMPQVGTRGEALPPPSDAAKAQGGPSILPGSNAAAVLVRPGASAAASPVASAAPPTDLILPRVTLPKTATGAASTDRVAEAPP